MSGRINNGEVTYTKMKFLEPTHRFAGSRMVGQSLRNYLYNKYIYEIKERISIWIWFKKDSLKKKNLERILWGKKPRYMLIKLLDRL